MANGLYVTVLSLWESVIKKLSISRDCISLGFYDTENYRYLEFYALQLGWGLLRHTKLIM